MLTWRIVFFALVLMFTAVATPLSGFFGNQNASAITDQQKQDCFNKFNAKDIIFGELSLTDQQLLNECRSSGDCKDAGEGAKIGSRRITCTNPALELAAKQAADAEVKPLQTLVCGPVPAGEAAQSVYIQCSDNVRKIYESCDNTGGGVTGSGQDTNENTSICVRNKLPNPKPTIQQVRTAVAKGRNDAQGIVDEAIKKQEQDKKKADCEAAGGTWENSKCTPKSDEEETSTCGVEKIGWIICPVVGFLASIVDAAYGIVSSLLSVQPLTTTSQNNPMYSAWSIMRNFANIAFVIVFLIIIFSQITSVGVSNYGIKKMLPRLIVAAVLVNISYWVCAIAVDISNISGSSINNLFKGIGLQLENPSFSGTDSGTSGWSDITGKILLFGGATVALLYIGLSALIPALLMAVLAIVTVFLVLTLRQALIILLIVVSPLAFVAYLLPNTESLFKRWRQLLQTLLLMFPIIGLIFGASALASQIVMASADKMDSDYKIAVQVMGAGIGIIPLAITPIFMKTAGGILGKFGAFVNNPKRGPYDRLRKKAGSFRDYRNDINRTRRVGRAKSFLEAGGPLKAGEKRSRGRRLGAWIAGAGTSTAINQEQRDANAKRALTEEKQSYVAGRASSEQAYAESIAGPTGDVEAVVASAQDAVRQEHIKNVQQQRAKLRSEGHSSDDLVKMVANGSLSQVEREAAAEEVGANGRAQSVQDLIDVVGQLGQQRASMDPNSAEAQAIKDLQQTAAGSIGASKGKPKSMSGTNLEQLRAGEFTGSMDSLVTKYLTDGKQSKEKMAAMDIDELMHMSRMVSGGHLAGLDPAKKQITIDAIDELLGNAAKGIDVADPTLRSKLEPRQVAELENIRTGL